MKVRFYFLILSYMAFNLESGPKQEVSFEDAVKILAKKVTGVDNRYVRASVIKALGYQNTAGNLSQAEYAILRNPRKADIDVPGANPGLPSGAIIMEIAVQFPGGSGVELDHWLDRKYGDDKLDDESEA